MIWTLLQQMLHTTDEVSKYNRRRQMANLFLFLLEGKCIFYLVHLIRHMEKKKEKGIEKLSCLCYCFDLKK